jgi:hypothetical protein
VLLLPNTLFALRPRSNVHSRLRPYTAQDGRRDRILPYFRVIPGSVLRSYTEFRTVDLGLRCLVMTLVPTHQCAYSDHDCDEGASSRKPENDLCHDLINHLRSQHLIVRNSKRRLESYRTRQGEYIPFSYASKSKYHLT